MPHRPLPARPAALALAQALGDARPAPASRRFARWVLGALLAAGGSAALAATPAPQAAPADAPRPPNCADRPLPPAIRELALPADQLARVTAALRAACERDQQAREEDRRALAALLTPEQMHRVEGRLRPPCRPERDAGAQER